jgi:hypothetical protein
VQLCGHNGTGLIVNEQLLSIAPYSPSANCLIMGNTDTSAPGSLQYVFVGQVSNLPVTAAVGSSGKVRITTSSNTQFTTNDRVLATCRGITGTTEANVTSPAIINDNYTTFQRFTLSDTAFANIYTGGGTCDLVGLSAAAASTVGHTTAPNGVEVASSDPTKTLVGVVYMDSSQLFNDSSTHRDVASWFNRRIKTCKNVWGLGGAAVSSTTYVEVTGTGGGLHCEFVSWANDDLSWSLFGTMVNTTTSGTSIATLAGDFDSSSTTEAENVQWSGGTSALQFPLNLTGSASFATEALHYLTMFGKSTAGSTTVVSGITGALGANSGEEVRVPQ